MTKDNEALKSISDEESPDYMSKQARFCIIITLLTLELEKSIKKIIKEYEKGKRDGKGKRQEN